MPPPDPEDLFFDLEGDPLEEGGLDYLWGLHFRDGSQPEFKFEWALSVMNGFDQLALKAFAINTGLGVRRDHWNFHHGRTKRYPT